MIVIGIDSHKRTHTAVAADGNGRKVGETTVVATSDGHLGLVRWASRFPERRFALEDTRHLSRRLSADLLRAGEAVAWVPTRLMAGARRHGREQGKSDPIDALAVARAALANPGLPVATLEGTERELRLLVDHRDDLVAERTRAMNRLRWHLHELDPGNEPGAAQPRPRRRPAGPRRAPRRRPGHGRPDRPRARRPDPRADPDDRRPRARDHEARPRGRPDPARAARLRTAVGRQARRPGRRHRPLPLRRRVRPPQRLGTAAGLVGQRRAPPAVAQGRPPGQRRAPPDRHHPDADRRRRPGVLRAPPGGGRHEDRGHPGPPTPDQRRGLPPDAAR